MSPLTAAAWAVPLGGLLGIGLWTLLTALPRWSAPNLTRRLTPYLRDVADRRGLSVDLAIDPGGLVIGAGRRLLGMAARRVTGLLGGSQSVALRLGQAGAPTDVVRFRSRQILWGGAAALATLALIALGRTLTPLPVQVLLLSPLTAAGAAVLCDLALSRQAAARMARISDELPTVLEFLSLCLAAGEGILDSLARVGERGRGELARELRGVVLDVRTGRPLAEALSALSFRLQHAALTRAVEQLLAALERGAPLAHVLQDQAGDAREQAKRVLIEQAGRKEIAMLVPLVFGMLPLSVLFAVFPGIVMLNLGVG